MYKKPSIVGAPTSRVPLAEPYRTLREIGVKTNVDGNIYLARDRGKDLQMDPGHNNSQDSYLKVNFRLTMARIIYS